MDLRHALTIARIALVIAGTEVPAYDGQAPARDWSAGRVGRNFSSGGRAPQRVDADDAIAAARAYLARWETSLAAVVAEERYTQKHWDAWRPTTRRLVSDVLLVHAPAEDAWLMFRDVMSVDGKEVRDRQLRFDELFARPNADWLASARRIADESARYNLGRVTRNLNTPVSPLLFLKEQFAANTRWRKPKPVTIDGAAVLEIPFEQTRGPFAIHTPEGRGQPASGRMWIAHPAGRIVRAELLVESDVTSASLGQGVRSRLTRWRGAARVTSHFGAVPGLDVWVPLRMEEMYELTGLVSEHVEAEAVYANHRMFRTSARIVGHDRDN